MKKYEKECIYNQIALEINIINQLYFNKIN